MTASDREMGDFRRDEVIAGEYVLGVLSEEDRRKVEVRLASDRNFAAMVNRWAENLSSFNDDYETIAPPQGLYRPFESRIFAPTAGDALMTVPGKVGFWNSLIFWRSIAFASVAAAAGFGIVAGSLLSPQHTSSPLVAELTGDANDISLMAFYDTGTGALKLTPVAAAKETKKSLEVWLVEEGRPPVSLGVLPQTGEGKLSVPQAVRRKVATGAVLAVSVEPLGGSPTGAATGPIIASGKTRSF
ncbi:anti-sigma factor [Sinorhizobium sp. BG8]|uniref:anti-sigma factor n=1 Tax=Sinorhizobium sp. BG8 TaxID=2613773 RepID=UPI00193CD8ED|nr:anti-sigma factor [Sinorhizobium sp. BG8]QRM54056.1 anti-sigma factor [Sinorhizobium sp. BG8]